MKTNDSDNENFLSDQSLHFTLLGSDGSPRLKWFLWIFCLMTVILMPEIDFKLLCPYYVLILLLKAETPTVKPMFEDRNC